MKQLTKITAVVAAILFLASPIAFAATQSSAPISISAQVNGTLSIAVNLFRNSVSAANDIPDTAMSFGTLLDDDANNTLRSTIAGSTGTASVVALISANSSGLPYTISQTSASALTSGSNIIPSGATTVVPVYAPADNAGLPLVGSMGTMGTWVGSRTLYTSDGVGTIRTIQAHYSITDDPAAGSTAIVPLSQAAGTYTGTVTFTVTA